MFTLVLLYNKLTNPSGEPNDLCLARARERGDPPKLGCAFADGSSKIYRDSLQIIF